MKGSKEIDIAATLEHIRHHPCTLVPDVLQRGRDVNLFGTLHHPVEHHVYQDVGSCPTHAIAAVDNHGAGPAAVALVYFSSELQDRLGGGGDVAVRPGEEVELGDGAGLPGLAVLKVKRANEVLLAPDVLRHKVHLEYMVLF